MNIIVKIRLQIGNFLRKHSKLFLCLLVLMILVIAFPYVYNDIKESNPNNTQIELIGYTILWFFGALLMISMVISIIWAMNYISNDVTGNNYNYLSTHNDNLTCRKDKPDARQE